MNNRIIITVLAGAACIVSCNTMSKVDKEILKVMSQMTQEEKVLTVMGTSRSMNNGPEIAPGMPVRPRFNENSRQISYTEVNEDATTAFTQGRVNGAAAESYAIPRLGIPITIMADGPAGLRISPTRRGDSLTYYCTAFPTGTCLAASWDTDMVHEVTLAMGNEVHEYGVDYLLAPAINIMRSPLCGRNFEYYSEDPVLAGRIATAYINGIQENNVGVSLKHYAVNSQETMRNGIDAVVSERAIREIYLKGFEIAVKNAHPWTVMSSYNKVNGTLASENKWLLSDVLRDEWGFDGFVMTDWWAEENGARQIAAGNDMLMPGTQHQEDDIFAALKDGSLDEALLDKAVFNILKTMRKTPSFNGYKYSNKPNLKAHADIVRKDGAQGMVLLENNGALPLASGIRKIAALGDASYDTFVGGSGSGNVNRKYKVNISEGLQNAGYQLDQEIADAYAENIRKHKPQGAEYMWVVPVTPELGLTGAQAKRLARDNDIAIYTLSRIAGEGADRRLEPGDYYLSEVELSEIKLLSEAFHAAGKKLIVLLNMGSMVEMSGWNHLADAILHIWLPGQEVGNSVADVVTGKVNPSGKLPFSITATYQDNPSSANFPLSPGEDRRTIYKEDIYVGYRYYDKNNIEPTYPFGYGLSYTTFDYSDMKISREDDNCKVSLTVTNTGKVPGREVVQIYVTAPKGSVDKPIKELKAFVKTPVIEPGKSATVNAELKVSDMASFVNNKWDVTPGTYTFMAAASSRDIRLSQNMEIK